jgi:hypothetical protein
MRLPSEVGDGHRYLVIAIAIFSWRLGVRFFSVIFCAFGLSSFLFVRVHSWLFLCLSPAIPLVGLHRQAFELPRIISIKDGQQTEAI